VAVLARTDLPAAGAARRLAIGDDACPRCKGQDRAKLFAREVQTLHDHLARSNRILWMWGDRFLNGDVSGLGQWEASLNSTQAALHSVPKDIVISDWHYDSAVPTAALFATEGFNVISSPWRKANVALGQLELIRTVRANANDTIGRRMQGVLQTTWCDLGDFVKAYYGEDTSSQEAREAANCFKTLFSAIRNSGLK